jgi:hypothetical protein
MHAFGGWLLCVLPWHGCMMRTSDHGLSRQRIFATAPWLDMMWPHGAVTSHEPALYGGRLWPVCVLRF